MAGEGIFSGSKTFLDMYCLSSQHGLVEFQSVGNWGAKIHPSGSADKLLREDPNYSFPESSTDFFEGYCNSKHSSAQQDDRFFI